MAPYVVSNASFGACRRNAKNTQAAQDERKYGRGQLDPAGIAATCNVSVWVNDARQAGQHFAANVVDRTGPVFRLKTGAAAEGARVIAWFDSREPLRSGWAWGQPYLENGVAAVEVPLGKGRVLLFGPQILQRAQPHGTFKFLFNGIVGAGTP